VIVNAALYMTSSVKTGSFHGQVALAVGYAVRGALLAGRAGVLAWLSLGYVPDEAGVIRVVNADCEPTPLL